jgi:hypothetical protein
MRKKKKAKRTAPLSLGPKGLPSSQKATYAPPNETSYFVLAKLGSMPNLRYIFL